MISLPARRHLGTLTLAAVMSISFVACGDDSDSGDDSGGSGSADVLDEDTLEEALIGSDDLPDGFTVSEDDDDETSTGTCLDDIDASTEGEDLEPENEAKVEFVQEEEQGQSQVSSTVESYADADTARSAIEAFLEVAEDCTSAQGEDENGVTYDLMIETSEDEVVDGADRQVNVDVTGTFSAQGQEFQARFGFVVASIDNELTAVAVSDVGVVEGVIDQLEEIAQTQLDRLADAG